MSESDWRLRLGSRHWSVPGLFWTTGVRSAHRSWLFCFLTRFPRSRSSVFKIHRLWLLWKNNRRTLLFLSLEPGRHLTFSHWAKNTDSTTWPGSHWLNQLSITCGLYSKFKVSLKERLCDFEAMKKILLLHNTPREMWQYWPSILHSKKCSEVSTLRRPYVQTLHFCPISI